MVQGKTASLTVPPGRIEELMGSSIFYASGLEKATEAGAFQKGVGETSA